MSEVLRFSCPHCRIELSAGSEYSGQTAPCPVCGLYLVLPGRKVSPLEEFPPSGISVRPIPHQPASQAPGSTAVGSTAEMGTGRRPPNLSLPPPRRTIPPESAPAPAVPAVIPLSPAAENHPGGETVADEGVTETAPAPLRLEPRIITEPAPAGNPEGKSGRMRPPESHTSSVPLPFKPVGAPLAPAEGDPPMTDGSREAAPHRARVDLLKAAALLVVLGGAAVGGYLYLQDREAPVDSVQVSPAAVKSEPGGPLPPTATPGQQPTTGTSAESSQPIELLKELPGPEAGNGNQSLLPRNMIPRPLRPSPSPKPAPPSSPSPTPPAGKAPAPPVSAPPPAAAATATPFDKARQVLDSFLAAADWRKRLEYSLKPERLRDPMAVHFKDHPDGPIPVERVSFLTEGEIPDNGGHYYGFRVRVKNFPADIPMAIEERGGVFRVDWASFQETYEQRLKAFFAKPVKEPGRFRVVLQRKHYFGPPVPGQDSQRQSFSVESPMRDESWIVWADLSSSCYKTKIATAGRDQWDTESFLVAELAWDTDGNGGKWVSIRDIVADNWQMR